MNVAAYVEALQQDLANVAGIGDEAVAEAARGSPRPWSHPSDSG